jgi:hypothetical protein
MGGAGTTERRAPRRLDGEVKFKIEKGGGRGHGRDVCACKGDQPTQKENQRTLQNLARDRLQ